MIPPPETLTRIDRPKHTINLVIVVVGTCAEETLDALAVKVGGTGIERKGPTVFLGLSLGEIRGWKTLFHLYGFSRAASAEAKRHLARADGVIVAEDTAAQSQLEANALAPTAKTAPGLLHASSTNDEVFTELKAVAKKILLELKKDSE